MFIRKRQQFPYFPVVKHEKITIESQLESLINGAYRINRDGITQSLLSNWTCRVKFCLACQEWTTKDHGKNTHFGSMCHDICERSYKQNKILSSREIDNTIDLFIKKNRNNSISWGDGDIEFQSAIVKTVMCKYSEIYESDFDLMNIKKVENTFSLQVKDAQYNIKGKIDLLFEYKKDFNKLIIMEHKSMGTIREDILKARLPIDKQNLFYITALDYCGVKVNNILYNIIRRPQIKRTNKESIKDFCKRLSLDIDSRPEFYFIRYPVYYSEKDKLNYMKQLFLKFNEIDLFTRGKLPMYRNEFSCESSNNGAPFTCEFLEACGKDDLSAYVKKDLFSELK